MLTRPAVADETIVACLCDSYGLRVSRVTFLPIGADVGTAVYRVHADDGRPYLLKLRRGDFDEVAATVPALLHGRGIERVMAPIATTAHRLWVDAHGFHWMLYPFTEGKNGYAVPLSQRQWMALGEIMRAVHASALPAELERRVPREDFSPRWRNAVKAYDQQAQTGAHADAIAARLAELWLLKREEIRSIVQRPAQLAEQLRRRALELVLCHGDLHAGNVLLTADDGLWLVDWDNLVMAPRERDLMSVGGGLWRGAHEEAPFYDGYGPAELDPVALAYYRYERIVADIAADGERLFGVRGSEEDRAEGLRQLTGQFRPDGVVEIAHRTYRRLT